MAALFYAENSIMHQESGNLGSKPRGLSCRGSVQNILILNKAEKIGAWTRLVCTSVIYLENSNLKKDQCVTYSPVPVSLA